jgi:phospholipid/cholesterol/gamma-HCH transport system permease protein
LLQQALATVLQVLGQTFGNGWQVLGYVVKGQFNRSHCLQQLAFLGVDSLPIALILTTFSAMVIALQVATEMAKQGAASFVGGLVSMALVRELAPMMSGFAVLALAGSAYAAELASMKVNSQLDALSMLQVSPLRYLFVPRVLAGLIGLPLILIVTTVAGLYGGLLVSYWAADIPPMLYLDSVWSQTSLYDVGVALLKAASFGLLITLLSCTIGSTVQNTGLAVSAATPRAVVWSFVTIALMDLIITFVFYGR